MTETRPTIAQSNVCLVQSKGKRAHFSQTDCLWCLLSDVNSLSRRSSSGPVCDGCQNNRSSKPYMYTRAQRGSNYLKQKQCNQARGLLGAACDKGCARGTICDIQTHTQYVGRRILEDVGRRWKTKTSTLRSVFYLGLFALLLIYCYLLLLYNCLFY